MSRIKIRVSQRSVLGLLLFIMYVNHVSFGNATSEFVIFVDDTTVPKIIKNHEELEQALEDAQLKASD